MPTKPHLRLVPPVRHIPPAAPDYCFALGEHITAKPGFVEIEHDHPVKLRRYTVRQLRAMIDKYDAMAMQAELMGEEDSR